MSAQEKGIWERFQLLPTSSETIALGAVHCCQGNSHLLIKGQSGEPILLVSALRRARPRAPVKLKHVSISFDVFYEVSDTENGVTTGTFTRFSCDPASPSLHRYFIEILIAATQSGDNLPAGEHEVDTCVSAILEVFRRFSAPPRTTVVGLWGEILLIRKSTRPEIFVKAWHNDLCETFDFAFEAIRVEVKTSERKVREHDFSLRQLDLPREGDFVASVLVTRSAAGKTVFDLVDEICVSLKTEQREKLFRVTLETLGDDAEMAASHCFDFAGAMDSMVFLSTALIPSPTVEAALVDTVSNVRFQANISDSCERRGFKKIPI